MKQRCPLCNSEKFTVVYKHVPQFPDSDIVQCNQCGHKYSIINKEIDVDQLYSDEVYKVVENRDSIFDRIIQREYNGVLRRLDKIKVGKGNLLDFGCGKGKFGHLAQENGWNVKAVETSPDRAAYARNIYGLDVSSEFFTAGSIFNIQFDALSLFHVLEHLPQPAVLLEQLIKDNVTGKGIVIVEVPNVSSWQSRIAKESWIHLDVPRHLHHFSPERLKKLLLDINLKPLKTTSFSVHLGVLGMVDSLLKKFGYKKNIIFELKNNKSKSLILMIMLILPFAFVLESLASLFGKGGVIRMYTCNYNRQDIK
jgi:2-polyprenyl-3-methyl-5-hydroxy-6-metoxy-1,4-benzoquinol methylase